MFSLVFCVNNKTFAIFAPTNIFILANPPADGSAWMYELVEVLEDKEIIGPELPVEATIKSEADIVYEEQCPI